MPNRSERPRPVADECSQPFWQAAQRHQLVIQRCRECGYFNHPPRPACDACQSQSLQFESVSGRGTIYSFSVMHQPNIAGFEDQIPYLSIFVELAEQPLLFMVSNLPISEREKVRIGARVEVYFEKVDAELTLPQFQLV
jgi:uncharacterized OB-fold protein